MSVDLQPSGALAGREDRRARINIERCDTEEMRSSKKSAELCGILHTRRHLAATPVFKGIPNFRETRIRMLRAEKADELLAILEHCNHYLADSAVAHADNVQPVPGATDLTTIKGVEL